MALVNVTIDGVQHRVEQGRNMLDVCLSLGIDLPYFCWHPAMGSVGACRQCAVRQYWVGRDGKEQSEIVMACMTNAEEGTKIDVFDDEAVRLRRSVIELLMMSHPHDCPVCDEGGECHLQDMTVMTGHVYRRYRFKKRSWTNQDLGPFVTHEMNRCIQCYRCTRFYNDYAGGHDFGIFGIRHEVYFGRLTDGVLESEFSGNLVEVCPVGVFDDKTLAAHYTRKWDLQTAPAVCVFCGRGCNTIPGERYGELRRVLNRYNGEVNGYFLCDRGRYAYESVNGDQRIRQPVVGLAGLSAGELVRGMGARLESAARERRAAVGARPRLRTPRPVGIGSPRASLEANWALKRLVGEERFFTGFSAAEQTLAERVLTIMRQGPSPAPTLRDLDAADLVLILGEDLTNTAPMLDFSVRRWLRLRPLPSEERLHIERWNDAGIGRVKEQEPSALWVADTHAGKLDALANETWHAAPDDLARFALALARAVSGTGRRPKLSDLETATVNRWAAALRAAARPLVISGTSAGSLALLDAAAALAWSLPGWRATSETSAGGPDEEGSGTEGADDAGGGAASQGDDAGRAKGGAPAPAAPLALVVPEGNTLGLAMIGGRPLSEAFDLAAKGDVEVALIVENDLYRRAPDTQVDAFLRECRTVLAIDHVTTATTAGATATLPAASWAEATQTYVNLEGRAQRSFQVMVPDRSVQPSWRWLSGLATAARLPVGQDWYTVDDVLDDLARERPDLAPAALAAPPAGARVREMKVARQSARYSGRTAMHADRTVHEPAPVEDRDAPLRFSMEGADEDVPAPLVERYVAPRWHSVQALNKFQQEVGGPLRGGDPGVRLVEPPAGDAAAPPRPAPPPAFAPSDDHWLAVPLHHIYGSEELSMLSPPIAGRAPEPYVALAQADAERLGAREGDVLDVAVRSVPPRPPEEAPEVEPLEPFPEPPPGVPRDAEGEPIAGPPQGTSAEGLGPQESGEPRSPQPPAPPGSPGAPPTPAADASGAELRLALPLRIVPSLPTGVCGLPAGLPQLPFLELPGEARIARLPGSTSAAAGGSRA